MNLEVRPIAAHELDAVSEGLSSRPRATHERRIELQLLGGFVYLIAWLDGVAVGHVGLGFVEGRHVDDLCEFRGYPVVSDLHVMAEHRGHGIGRALMEALHDRVREEGERGVALDTGVDDSFAAARGLYSSMGYREQGGVFLGGWSDPEQPGVHFCDPLTIWLKDLER
jgi:GNAT superfamily N-acetyltransferase